MWNKLGLLAGSAVDAAKIYLELGLSPIPVHGISEGRCTCKGEACEKPGKHPVSSAWNSRKFVPSSFGPDMNVGLRMGGGLVAIDVDGDAGFASLAKAEEELGALPPTLTARTGSGGEHRVFSCPPVKTRRGWRDHVDVRGEGGQIVVAPSKHVRGEYQWTRAMAPTELPQAWVEALNAPAVASGDSKKPRGEQTTNHMSVGADTLTRARAWLAKREPAISGQGGHDKTFFTAKRLVEFGLDETQCRGLLEEWNQTCQPPWSQPELEHKLTQAFGAYALKPAEDRPPPATRAPVIALRGGPVEDWAAGLQRSEKGGLLSTQVNVELLLERHPDWAGIITWNAFTGRLEATRPLSAGERAGEWSDLHDSGALVWLEKAGCRAAISTVQRSVGAIGGRHPHHPVREYFSELVWDETPRLMEWLARGFGANPFDRFVRVAGQKWMLSSVARIFEPGCQADYVIVLEGEQGTRKSSGLRHLVGRPEWFTDQLPALDSKDSSLQIEGIQILELSELAVTRRSDTETVKAFITRRVDRVRRPWDRRPTDIPRQCIFAATVNPCQYLHDVTGGRRFWPIATGVTDIGWIESNRDQLWAEAVSLYRAGENRFLSEVDERLARMHQDRRRLADPWEDRLSAILDGKDFVRSSEVLTQLGFETASRVDPTAGPRLGRAMRALGWTSVTRGNHRGWARDLPGEE